LEEALEVTCIYSINDMLPADEPLIRHRPSLSASYDLTCGPDRRRPLAAPG
jgi:hypothetical protein